MAPGHTQAWRHLGHRGWEGVMLLALSGQGPQRLLSTPQRMGRPHGTENEQPQMPTVPRLGDLGLEPTKSL